MQSLLILYKGTSPLHIAVEQGSVQGTRILLSHEAIDVNCQNDEGETPLYLACQGGHTDIVKLLLEDAKIDVNKASIKFVTPLFVASTNGFAEICRLLIARDEIKENAQNEDGVCFQFTRLQLLRVQRRATSRWLTSFMKL